MYDAAPDLERRYKKTLLLMNSGSGYSDDPLVMAQDLAKYIEEKKTAHFSMGLFTSAPSSPLAEITAKYGNVVTLKGRGKNKPGAEYAETGMMGDIFELGTLELLNSMIEAIFRNLPVGDVFRLCEEEFEKVGDMINNNVNSETYTQLVDIIRRQRHSKRNCQNDWCSTLPHQKLPWRQRLHYKRRKHAASKGGRPRNFAVVLR
jgi:hypothetical protein